LHLCAPAKAALLMQSEVLRFGGGCDTTLAAQ
jgi:hypothetical protein